MANSLCGFIFGITENSISDTGRPSQREEYLLEKLHLRSWCRHYRALALLSVLLTGCTSPWPSTHLDAYLAPPTQRNQRIPEQAAFSTGPLTVGLSVLNETSKPGDAPNISKNAFASLTQYMQAQLMKHTSIQMVRILPSQAQMIPHEHVASILQLGNEQNLAYLILAILSSTETEIPTRLPLQGSVVGGGAMGGLLPGYRAENYAQAELALVKTHDGQVVFRVDGQAWASLEYLDVPLDSNVYPVVRRDYHIAPIYPTEHKHAHDVLRATASSDAVNQAVMHFKEVWENSP